MKKIILYFFSLTIFIIFMFLLFKCAIWERKQETIVKTYCDKIIKTEYITGNFWQRGRVILFLKNGNREYFNINTEIPKEKVCIITLFDGRKLIR